MKSGDSGAMSSEFIMRVEAVESLAGIAGGRGGFWEDAGSYYWYAGV